MQHSPPCNPLGSYPASMEALTTRVRLLARHPLIRGVVMAQDALSITSFVISFITFIFNMIWSPFQKTRSDQIRLSLDMKRKYTMDNQQHLDILYKWKEAHGEFYWRDWMLAMKDGMDPASEEKKVDNARRDLGAYWDELLEYYEIGSLPTGPRVVPNRLRGPFWVPKDMLSGNFARKAISFLKLVEPLEIANWYRLGYDKKGGDYAIGWPLRSGKYAKIEKLLKGDDLADWHKKFAEIVKTCREAANPPGGVDKV